MISYEKIQNIYAKTLFIFCSMFFQENEQQLSPIDSVFILNTVLLNLSKGKFNNSEPQEDDYINMAKESYNKINMRSLANEEENRS